MRQNEKAFSRSMLGLNSAKSTPIGWHNSTILFKGESMKSKMYKLGPNKYKAYMKPVGHGYEVGFMWGTKPLFVGNFVHQTEAATWFDMMKREYDRFARKYTPATAKGNGWAFYNKFIANTLYKHYYDYLDKCFGRHTRNYHREHARDVRAYKRMKQHWPVKENMPYARRAA
jgi:hypothetical protein